MNSFSTIESIPIACHNFWLTLEPEFSRLDHDYLEHIVDKRQVNQVIWFEDENPQITMDFKTQKILSFCKTLDGYTPSGLFYFPTYELFQSFQEQLAKKEFGLNYNSVAVKGLPMGRPQMEIPWGGFQPALFLDRDGIINIDDGYVFEFKNIQFVNGIFNLVKQALNKGYKIYVLTNQSGVGRGYYNEEQVKEVHLKMHKEFLKNDCEITDWIYSPFHEEGLGLYKGASLTRKPSPGMIHQLQRKYPLDLLKSMMIGDKTSDALFMQGPKYLHLQGEYDLSKSPHPVFQSLDDIIKDALVTI